MIRQGFQQMKQTYQRIKFIVSSPPWDQGVMIFMSTARQGATAKLQEPEWGHIKKGEMILGSQAGGWGLLYHDELLVFPQNASP